MAWRAFSLIRFRITCGREGVRYGATHSNDGTYQGFCSTAVIFGSFAYQRTPFIKLCHGIIRERRAWTARGNKGKDDLEDESDEAMCLVRPIRSHIQ